MDYSSIHSEDHPAGGSPWASSPQHNRSSFGDQPSNVPPSPLPPAAHSPYSAGDADAHAEHVARAAPHGTSIENGHHEGTAQQQIEAQAQQAQQPAPGQGYDGHAQHQQQQQPRQKAPQYKLQAKITGLERTGKKDPILRFDVYVGEAAADFCSYTDDNVRQTCPSSEPRNSATSGEHTPSL